MVKLERFVLRATVDTAPSTPFAARLHDPVLGGHHPW